LLAQHDLFLRLADLGLDFSLELLAQPEALELARDDLVELVHATANVQRRENVLARWRCDLDKRGADHVGERGVVVETLRDESELVGQHVGKLYHLAEGFEQVLARRCVLGIRQRLFARQPSHAGAQERMRLDDLDNGDALETFEDDHHGVGSRLRHLPHDRGRADCVEIATGGHFDIGMRLRHDGEQAFFAGRRDRLARTRSIQRHRQRRMWEQDHRAQRHDGQLHQRL
jgi:hypothetical protein